MLPLLTVLVGPTAKIDVRKGTTNRALRKLATLTAQCINFQHDTGKPCRPGDVVIRLFLSPDCPVYTLNAGDVSVSLELAESDLPPQDEESISEFTDSLAEAIVNDGPFARTAGGTAVTHCQVRCGHYLGRVVMF